MFGPFDHAGFLVRDLEAALEEARALFELPVARTAELAEYGITATFLGEGTGTLEIFTLADRALLDPRLGGEERRLDHVAYRVADLDAVAAHLRAAGVRFTGPDRREEISSPIELGGARHLWTVPDTTGGLAVQLTEPPAP